MEFKILSQLSGHDPSAWARNSSSNTLEDKRQTQWDKSQDKRLDGNHFPPLSSKGTCSLAAFKIFDVVENLLVE
jgi:hypothetical protein